MTIFDLVHVQALTPCAGRVLHLNEFKLTIN